MPVGPGVRWRPIRGEQVLEILPGGKSVLVRAYPVLTTSLNLRVYDLATGRKQADYTIQHATGHVGYYVPEVNRVAFASYETVDREVKRDRKLHLYDPLT